MAGRVNEISADDALKLLQEGNENYIADQNKHPNVSRKRREETATGQWPFAIVLTCADSRVSPELIFDRGIGDIFVLRVAGNVASSEVTGSIQYAVNVIKTKLVVVLGHEACGAVGAAVDNASGLPKELQALVDDIKQIIAGEKNLAKAIDKNGDVAAETLRNALPGDTKVVAATYALASGRVNWR